MPPANVFHCRWRALVVWLSVVVHALACLGMLLVLPGTEASANLDDRFRWIAAHPGLWQANWVAWMGASTSLLATMGVWGEHLGKQGVSRRIRGAVYALVAVGVACDLSGEWSLLTLLARPDAMQQSITAYQVLSPCLANGLYCLAGLWLSAVSWRTRFLRGGWALLGFAMWMIGLVLTDATLFALAGFDEGRLLMMVTGGAVMGLFMPWAAYLGWRVGRAE